MASFPSREHMLSVNKTQSTRATAVLICSGMAHHSQSCPIKAHIAHKQKQPFTSGHLLFWTFDKSLFLSHHIMNTYANYLHGKDTLTLVESIYLRGLSDLLNEVAFSISLNRIFQCFVTFPLPITCHKLMANIQEHLLYNMQIIRTFFIS